MSRPKNLTPYQQFTLDTLDRVEHQIDILRADVQQNSIDIATLKVKAGIWGLVGGAIPVVISLFIKGSAH